MPTIETPATTSGRWRTFGHLGVVSVVVAVALVATSRSRAWNSDDVGVQLALRHWTPFRDDLFWPESTWLLRAPLFLLTDTVFGPSSRTLLLQTVALNVISFAGIWWAARTAIRSISPESARADIVATVVTCWLATVSPTFVFAQLSTNGRCLEIGLVAAALVWWATRRHSGAARSVVATAAVFATLAVDDATIVYAIGVPAVAGAAAWWAVGSGRRLPQVGIVAALAIIGWQLGLALLRVLGLRSISLDVRTATPAEWLTTVPNAVQLLAQLLGLDVFGVPLRDTVDVGVGARLVALGLASMVLGRHRRTVAASRASAAMLVWFGGMLGVFVLSSHGLSAGNLRYVAYVLPAVAVLLAVATVLAEGRLSNVLLAALAIGALWGLGQQARTLGDDGAAPNAAAARLDETLDELGIEVAYGDFWETLAPAYLGGADHRLVPVACSDGRTALRRWFVAEAMLDPAAGATAYVHNTRPGLSACAIEDVVAQFGEPERRVSVTPELTVLIYDRDLSPEFAPPLPPG